MRKRQVPQDEHSTYGGHRKLLYAVDDDGQYTGVQSRGWEVETEATRAAIEELDRLRDEAWQRARAGETSPLEVHMYDCRMDVPLLAGATGLTRWRVRRHFHPGRYSRLSMRILQRYAQALGMEIETLRHVPPRNKS